MNFAEAIEFSKKFRDCHPKVFKGFNEWGVCDTETEGYVVLTDANLSNGGCSDQMQDYVKTHKLRIERVKNYLMICTPTSL